MPRSKTGLRLNRPTRILSRPIRADFDAIAEAVISGGAAFGMGDSGGLMQAGRTLFDKGLGLGRDQPVALAWELIYRSLQAAIIDLLSDHRQQLSVASGLNEQQLGRLHDEIELALNDPDLDLAPDFFAHPGDLALVAKLQTPLGWWLRSLGLADAEALAGELPQRFATAVATEWRARASHYAPLQASIKGPFDDAGEDLETLRRRYLDYLAETHGSLELQGLGSVVKTIERSAGLKLGAVYVPVKASPRGPMKEVKEVAGLEEGGERPRRDEAMPVEDLLQAHPVLVVLGDPGSGKSTLVKRLALDLGDDIVDGQVLLPIVLPLNRYADHLADPGEALPLRAWLPRYYAGRQSQLTDLGRLFEQAIDAGRALVLLDGLDEVQAQRGALVTLVDDFMRELRPKIGEADSGNRVLVTSRFYGYDQAPLLDSRWHTVALNDWDDDAIAAFLGRWTQAVELAMADGIDSERVRQQAAAERDALLAAISRHRNIRKLAGNPLLLTILALIKRQGMVLPNRRVELYDLYLKTLLESWPRVRPLDGLGIEPERDFIEVWRVLAPLGLWIRETDPQYGLVDEAAMRAWLADWFEAEDGLKPGEARKEAREFIGALCEHTSLLLDKGAGRYGFIHQTFGEYLAGYGLTQADDDGARLLERLADPGWHESILLGIGALGAVRRNDREAGRLLQRVLDHPDAEDQEGANRLTAGEVLRDVGSAAVGGRRVAARIIEALIGTMQGKAIVATRRRDAGRLLGEVGWRPRDLDLFLPVAAGVFLYGEEKQGLRIEERYWVAKYPVTNAQYQGFVDAGGYLDEQWWDNGGWRWRKDRKFSEPRYWRDEDYNSPLVPVVGVSIWEIRAYCRWLTERLRAHGYDTPDGVTDLPDGYAARLPTEQQWERAARGTDGREYSWGARFDVYRANTEESDNEKGYGVNTTAVTTYPAGETPVGAWDMAGNVWEVTDSGPGESVVWRGGSWNGYVRRTRCAVRDGKHPDVWDDDRGFRVFVSLANAGF